MACNLRNCQGCENEGRAKGLAQAEGDWRPGSQVQHVIPAWILSYQGHVGTTDTTCMMSLGEGSSSQYSGNFCVVLKYFQGER